MLYTTRSASKSDKESVMLDKSMSGIEKEGLLFSLKLCNDHDRDWILDDEGANPWICKMLLDPSNKQEAPKKIDFIMVNKFDVSTAEVVQ
jgi:hypothetical protein